MVVDGRIELVGSDERAARRALESAAGEAKASVAVIPAASGSVRITVAGARGADVLLAITEEGLASDVARGAGSHPSHPRLPYI